MSGFRSFLDAANGKAVSPLGTFGTSRRRMDLRQPTCGTDTIYFPSDGTETVMRSSKGVWRTEKRFTPLTDDASPGPIYKVPEDLTRQKGLSWGRPPPRRKDATSRGGGDASSSDANQSPLPMLREGSDLGNRGGGISRLSSNALMCSRPAVSTRCTFGTPHPSALPDKTDRASNEASACERSSSSAASQHLSMNASSSFLSMPSLVGGTQQAAVLTHIAPYKGRWGSPPKKTAVNEEEERRRKAKDKELLDVLRQGYIQQQTYRSSTPAFTMGSRAALIPPRSVTPGPNAYDVNKYKKDAKPNCPTFVGKGHDILEYQRGQDSPGPALYGQLRYPGE